jgi:hypothetical protein
MINRRSFPAMMAIGAFIAGLGMSAPALAAVPLLRLSETEQAAPALPEVLPAREQAAVIDRIIAERLDQIIPAIMREQGIDLWLLMAREYFEEPVVASMLDATSMHARRRTILIFYDPGEGKPVERLTVSRYGLGGLFTPAWQPEQQPDQWAEVAAIIAARDPARIAVNTSNLSAFGDGMTASQFNLLRAALPQEYHARIVTGEQLATRWLETRTPSEMAIYPGIVRIAHALIGEAFSR